MSEWVYVPEYWDLGTVEENIHRLRRVVLAHSVLYYKLGDSIVPDSQFDAWAYELVGLQKDHPEASEAVYYHREAFRGFTGETGYDLPLMDEGANRVAQRMLKRKTMKEEN
jgi:hypothetical protein